MYKGSVLRRIIASGLTAVIALAACSRSKETPVPRPEPTESTPVQAKEPAPAATTGWERERKRMVNDQIAARDITDERVLAALRKVPRHELVPESVRDQAYEDRPLPIGHGQTISQPYIVAIMTELAALSPGDRVLEVGTGSGYQAAVLAEIGAEVYSIEIVEPLGQRARRDLSRLRYDVNIRIGDGYRGWPDKAPFAAIIVTAAPPEVPEPLREQLAIGGRLVIPVGDDYQELKVITRTETGFDERTVFPVAFVPMTGEAQK